MSSDTADLVGVKQALRKRIIAARDALPEALRIEYSAKIDGILRAMPAYSGAKVVLAYLTFGSELLTDEFARAVLADGKTLLLPRLKADKSGLDIFQVRDLASELASGVWGIREPVPERCNRFEDLKRIDFILVPGVAFTIFGDRLGYGGGFYDRLLAGRSPGTAVVAGAFSLQLVEHVPIEQNDIPVDIIVTEQGEYRRQKQIRGEA